MGGYYYESRLYIPSVECLTPERESGVITIRIQKFKNLKNVIMKYQASIAVVGVS
jgi:hypothetical protein